MTDKSYLNGMLHKVVGMQHKGNRSGMFLKDSSIYKNLQINKNFLNTHCIWLSLDNENSDLSIERIN